MGLETAGLSHSAAAASLIGLKLRGERLSLRQRTFLVLEEPTSGLAAYALSLLIRSITLLSAAATTMESIPALTERTGAAPWLALNLVVNILFSLEAVARVVCYEPRRSAAFRDLFIWLDVLTVLPFWLRLGAHSESLVPSTYLSLIHI